MDFKKKMIIFKLKNGNFKTRDFSPLIERVLAGVKRTRGRRCSSSCLLGFLPKLEGGAFPILPPVSDTPASAGVDGCVLDCVCNVHGQ